MLRSSNLRNSFSFDTRPRLSSRIRKAFATLMSAFNPKLSFGLKAKHAHD